MKMLDFFRSSRNTSNWIHQIDSVDCLVPQYHLHLHTTLIHKSDRSALRVLFSMVGTEIDDLTNFLNDRQDIDALTWAVLYFGQMKYLQLQRRSDCVLILGVLHLVRQDYRLG